MSEAEWMFNGQILGDGFYLLKNGELFSCACRWHEWLKKEGEK